MSRKHSIKPGDPNSERKKLKTQVLAYIWMLVMCLYIHVYI